MFLLLTLPILISGFFLCHIHPIYKYKLHRYEGQYLYLKCATLGITCLFIASVSCLLINKYFPSSFFVASYTINIDISSYIEELIKSTTPEKNNSNDIYTLTWVIVISISTLFVPPIWSFLSYIRLCIKHHAKGSDFFKDTKLFVIANILSDSPLDNLLFKSSISKDDSPLMLSLKDRKVYVGQVISLGEPNEVQGSDQEISIIPIMSGYRDKDTLKVIFNTKYDDVDEDIYLTIRQDDIVSATQFSFDSYQKLNKSASVKKSFKKRISNHN